MKKIYLALMCMASLAIFTACGGGNASKNNTEAPADGEAAQEQVAEQGKAFEDMNGVEKCAEILKQNFNLTLADIQPDIEFTEQMEGYDHFDGDKIPSATAVYQKKDGTAFTEDEYKAWVGKIYEQTKKLSQDGKNVEGAAYVETAAEAMKEKSLDDAIRLHEWSFRKDGKFYTVYTHNQDGIKSPYADVTIALGIQKKFEDAIEDADKVMR